MAESDDIVNLARDALSDTFALASREKALARAVLSLSAENDRMRHLWQKHRPTEDALDVIEAACDLAAAWDGMGPPEHAKSALVAAVADLAAEHDGRWMRPDIPDINAPTEPELLASIQHDDRAKARLAEVDREIARSSAINWAALDAHIVDAAVDQLSELSTERAAIVERLKKGESQSQVARALNVTKGVVQATT
jgi:DNA-binding NarL/FixJ family response regulator